MASYFHESRAKACSLAYRACAALFLLGVALLELGCGDVYRPVVQIVPQQPPNPSAVHFVLAVSSNGAITQGSTSHLDVSGDTNLGVFQTGITPIHAAMQPNGGRVFVANLGDDTVTVNTTSAPTSASTISLAQGATPVFVNTAEAANVYVADYGTNDLAVINGNQNAVITTVPVGTHPIAVAEMPTTSNSQRVYVANQGSSDVTVINVVDDTVAKTIPLTGLPVWAVARSDGARIYVLDSSGTVSAISTLSDSVLSNIGVSSAGAGANFMFLDSKAQRLYVTNPNPAVHSLAIFDISEVSPAAPVNRVALLDLGQGASPAYLPASVTGIGDGSRAYVASYQLTSCSGTPCINTALNVIDVLSNTISKVVPITSGAAVDIGNNDGCGGNNAPPLMWTPGATTRFRVSTTASGGGSTSNFKVYVAQCDVQNIAVIDTFPNGSNPADTFAGVTVPLPLSAFPPQQVAISAATQNAATSTTPATTTFTYTQTVGPGLQVGMSIFVSGMSDVGNNGNFVVSALGAGTFTVVNALGVSNSTQNGTGAVIPRQNPVFMVAGP